MLKYAYHQSHNEYMTTGIWKMNVSKQPTFEIIHSKTKRIDSGDKNMVRDAINKHRVINAEQTNKNNKIANFIGIKEQLYQKSETVSQDKKVNQFYPMKSHFNYNYIY